MGFAQKLYRLQMYLKTGYSQLAFIISLINFLILLSLKFMFDITFLALIALALLPILMVIGRWYIKSLFGPHQIESKVKNRFSPFNQMVLHYKTDIAQFLLEPNDGNRNTLVKTIEKCQEEWLLPEY